MKKYIAELIGTFALTFAVTLALGGKTPISTPLLASLTLMLFVYSVGPISGTHINPAVTFALATLRKITLLDALFYMFCQFIGAGLALVIAAYLGMSPEVSAVSVMKTGIAELAGSFFFGFGIASVAIGAAEKSMSGIIVGGSLLLGVSIASVMGSNGILNPAVAFGVGSFNLMYLFGSVVGMTLGMWVYKLLLSSNSSHKNK